MSEQRTWESRYRVPEFIFGKEPNYFLQSCRGLLPASGKALAIADGEGRNGVWLAERGLSVVCLDFSEVGPTQGSIARQRAGRED